jgi:hypothetical protein
VKVRDYIKLFCGSSITINLFNNCKAAHGGRKESRNRNGITFSHINGIQPADCESNWSISHLLFY